MPVEWLSTDKCKKMLGPQIYGRLATAGNDRQPYITPVNYVYLKDAIFFHTGFSGRKLQNIAENPVVCFEISAPGNLYISDKPCSYSMRYWSILVTGMAAPVSDPGLRRDVMAAFMEKYAARWGYENPTDEDLQRVNIIKIEIGEISGRLSVDPEE